MDCCPPLPMNLIAELIAYQKIEDLPPIFTRTRAIADRMTVETKV